DQPGPEQRDGGVAQGFRVRNQVVAVAVVEAVVERLDQLARPYVIGEEIVIDQRDALAAERILHGENGGVEHQSALDVQCAQVRLTPELRPKMMPRLIRD